MSLQYLRDPWEDIFDSYHNCSSTKAQTMIFHRCPMIKNDQDKNNDDNIQGTVADQHRSFVRLIQAKTVLTGLKIHQRHIDMRQVIGRWKGGGGWYDDDADKESMIMSFRVCQNCHQ